MTERAVKTNPSLEDIPGHGAIRIEGVTLLGDPLGALIWPEEKLLVVSDLHLEKGSSFARQGIYLPPYDSRMTLSRIVALCADYKPERVIALGDSFHDTGAAARLARQDIETLRALTGGCDWIWIAGNHDPLPPTGFGGRIEETLSIGPLTFRHEPSAGPAAGEVAGHLHPCASVRVRGRRVRRRCFAGDGTRLVMPAFGAFTGGLCVLDPAFEPVFPDAFQAHLLGKDRVYVLEHRKLVPDLASPPSVWRM